MATKQNQLAEAVLGLIARQPNGKKAAKAVAAYLVDERRTKELHTLARSLEELRFKRDGSLEVTATSARPLSEEAKRNIRGLFKAKKIRIHEEINKDLTGGVSVRALDKVADFSVQARLRKLRQGA